MHELQMELRDLVASTVEVPPTTYTVIIVPLPRVIVVPTRHELCSVIFWLAIT